jgi:hypothetical protein
MSADPFSVELRIDEMIREQARVRPYLPRVQTIGEVQVDPEQVTVTIPRGMRQQLPAELIVEPVIDQQRLDRLEPEVRQPMEISLRLADGRRLATASVSTRRALSSLSLCDRAFAS